MLSLSIFTQSIVASHCEYNDLSEFQLDSIIITNDTQTLDTLIACIIATDSLKRDYKKESQLVNTAIDCLNPEILVMLYEKSIGLYNQDLDSITPIEYLLDENLDRRICNATANPISDLTLAERLNWTIKIALAFQPINDSIIDKISSRLRDLKSESIFQ